MTDQENELDLSPAEDVDQGVPDADTNELDQEIDAQATDAQDDDPGDDEPVETVAP